MTREGRAVVAALGAYLAWTGLWSIGWFIQHDPAYLIVPQLVLVAAAVVLGAAIVIEDWIDGGSS